MNKLSALGYKKKKEKFKSIQYYDQYLQIRQNMFCRVNAVTGIVKFQ